MELSAKSGIRLGPGSSYFIVWSNAVLLPSIHQFSPVDRKMIQRVPRLMLYALVWPYYVTAVRYTIEPLERMAGAQKDLNELSECVQDFARGKAAELKYIAFAVNSESLLNSPFPRLRLQPEFL